MKKDVSKALFDLFEEHKYTVYADIPLSLNPKKDSNDRYKSELEEIAVQRGKVLRKRMKGLELCEREARNARHMFVGHSLLLMSILAGLFLLPSFSWPLTIAFVIGLIIMLEENQTNRIFLTKPMLSEVPNFHLDSEIENDVYRQTGVRIKIYS